MKYALEEMTEIILDLAGIQIAASYAPKYP